MTQFIDFLDAAIYLLPILIVIATAPRLVLRFVR